MIGQRTAQERSLECGTTGPHPLNLGISTTVWLEPQSDSTSPAYQDCRRKTPFPALVLGVRTHGRRPAFILASVFVFAAAFAQGDRLGRDSVLELAALAVLSTLGMLWTRRTELRVNEEGLTATGDLGGPRPGFLRLPWNKVRELHFGPGGGGEIGGLYVREGAWCSRCILPRLTEAQAAEVIAVISQRYPSMLLSVSRNANVSVTWPASVSRPAPTVASAGPANAR